ncbi:MAG: hypothetical protein ACH0QD_10965 [Tepidibacillus sp.]
MKRILIILGLLALFGTVFSPYSIAKEDNNSHVSNIIESLTKYDEKTLVKLISNQYMTLLRKKHKGELKEKIVLEISEEYYHTTLKNTIETKEFWKDLKDKRSNHSSIEDSVSINSFQPEYGDIKIEHIYSIGPDDGDVFSTQTGYKEQLMTKTFVKYFDVLTGFRKSNPIAMFTYQNVRDAWVSNTIGTADAITDSVGHDKKVYFYDGAKWVYSANSYQKENYWTYRLHSPEEGELQYTSYYRTDGYLPLQWVYMENFHDDIALANMAVNGFEQKRIIYDNSFGGEVVLEEDWFQQGTPYPMQN